MRKLLQLSILALASAAPAYGADYEEVRELTLDSRGIDLLSVDNGAGSIEIVGIPGLDEVIVQATIVVPNTSEERARKEIAKDLRLSLQKNSDTAVLTAYMEQSGFFNFGNSASVSLEIRMPQQMSLYVDDGSGSIDVEAVRGDVELDDGSGPIHMTDVGGQVEIDDGSGSITVTNVGGDIAVDDGSGGIRIRGVAGSVIVDDGSGGIDVADVEEDVTVVDDGSGSLEVSNIGGRVRNDS